MSDLATIPAMDAARPEPAQDRAMRRGLLKLLDIKDSDIRILTLEQCRDAVDKGLHAGGAFSATIPLVALFYGGFLDAGCRRSHAARAGHVRPEQRPRRGHAGFHLCGAGLLRPADPG